MKYRLQVALLASALLAAGSVYGDDTEPSEADWRWLSNEAERAMDSLMPLGRSAGTTVTFRSFRDLYHNVPERYFRISQEFSAGGSSITAMLVVPVGKSLQSQLLALHMRSPNATAETLLPKLLVTRSELDDTSCPELRARMDKVAKLKVEVPSFDLMTIHPTNYNVTIRTGMGDINANLVDEHHPLVQWALKTHDVLQRCAAPVRESTRP